MARGKEGRKVLGSLCGGTGGVCAQDRWLTRATGLQRNGGGPMMDEPCVKGGRRGVCLSLRGIDVQESLSVPRSCADVHKHARSHTPHCCVGVSRDKQGHTADIRRTPHGMTAAKSV